MPQENEPEIIIEFSHSRLEDLIQALAYAAIDDFDAALSLMRDDGEDIFAWLEAGFNDFLTQLSGAKAALRDALVRAEESNHELEAKLETIERQQAAIRELSTPMIEVWSGVLCLPVVGIVDSQRSAEMTEALLEAIVDKQARIAIIDITGIDAMDTKTADHFIKMAKAVRLLGSECILSGINPAIAQTLTHIGVDLTGIRTLRNLRDALQAFLRDQAALHLGHSHSAGGRARA
jgi:rsbT co-antagonist protein RsbR